MWRYKQKDSDAFETSKCCMMRLTEQMRTLMSRYSIHAISRDSRIQRVTRVVKGGLCLSNHAAKLKVYW